MREVTIALVQSSPVLADNERNLSRMAEVIGRICGEQKTDLIVFPELAVSGYECGWQFTQLAERTGGHAVSFLAEKAATHSVHLVFGMPVKEKVESIIYDAAVVIGPDGEFVGDYRKLHLRGEEQMSFRAGYRMPVFELSLGRLGVMIGWDLAFPEVARSLVLDGAEVIAVCAAWERSRAREWQAFTVARACENAVYVAAAGRVGSEPSYAFGGGSTLIGPRGDSMGRLDEDSEGYVVATIDLDEVRRVREDLQILQCRQPSAYRSLVRKY